MGPLVDTSVLIDYFNGTISPETDALDRLLSEGPAPSTAPVIVQEFLQGFRPSEVELGRVALKDFHRLQPPSYALHEDAADLSRRFRARGKAASTVDALIVRMAAEYGVDLLTRDSVQRDLAHLAKVKAL